MGKSLLAVALALSLTLVAPAQGQQGHENTFPTIHGMWEQDARTGQCFYHPPPPPNRKNSPAVPAKHDTAGQCLG